MLFVFFFSFNTPSLLCLYYLQNDVSTMLDEVKSQCIGYIAQVSTYKFSDLPSVYVNFNSHVMNIEHCSFNVLKYFTDDDNESFKVKDDLLQHLWVHLSFKAMPCHVIY